MSLLPPPTHPSTPRLPSEAVEPPAKASYFPTFGRARRKLKSGGRTFWQKARRGLLWLMVAIAAGHLSLNLWATVQLNRELAAIHSQGQALTFQELLTTPVSPERNAAPLYQRADAALTAKARHILKGQVGRSEDGLKSVARTLSREELKQNQAALDLLRLAAAKPACRFNVNYDNPWTAQFPQLGMMRQLARLMRAQALQEAQDGQTMQALSDTQVIFQMSHHLAGELTLIGFLVSEAIEKLGYKTLDEVLLKVRLTPQQGQALLRSLPVLDWSKVLPHTMQGERAFGLWSFEAIRGNPSLITQFTNYNGADQPANPSLLRRFLGFIFGALWSPLSKLDEVQYLRYMKRVVAACSQAPFPTQPQPPLGMAQEIPSYAILTRVIAPVFGNMPTRHAEDEVTHRLAEVAVALCAYRTAQGHYPAQLADITSLWGNPLPLDPYAGKAFIYKPAQEGFDLYSIGPNQKDDGGKNRHLPADDILWPPQRR